MFFYLLAIASFGFAVFLLPNEVYKWRNSYRAKNKLLKKEVRAFDSIILKALLPVIEMLASSTFLLQPFNLLPPFVKGGLRGGRYHKYITENMKGAGLLEKMEFKEFLIYQLLMSLLFAVAAALIFFKISLILILISALLGFGYPFLWLRSLKKERADEIAHNLPIILDLLTLSVEAGLDFMSAVARIVERGGRSVVTAELGRMLGEVKIGRSRSDALIEFKERLECSAVNSVIMMLLQAEKLGASIGPILKAHSAKLRSERFQAAEKAGIKASQKLLVPLIFCIMPAVFIIIFGPLLVMWRSGTFEMMF